MNDWADMLLLREYAEHGTEEAFTILVSRHLNMVYHAALRQTRQSELAAEVVQTVFTLLARKATRLWKSNAQLSGWLFNTARFVSTRTMRGEIRRELRQAEAARMNADPSSPQPTEQMEPFLRLLDEMLARLPNRDRQAVLARYFEGKSFLEVGLAVGTTEETARKRVQRALEKLRGMFEARGVTLSAAALTATLETTNSQAVPAGLSAIAVSGVALKGVTGISGLSALTRSTLELMKWAKLKLVGGTVLAVVMGIAIFGNYRHPHTGAADGMSAAEIPAPVATLQNEVARLQTENGQLAAALASATDRKMQLVNATQEAERLVRESQLVAARNFASTNDPPTMRDAFVSVGKLMKLTSISVTNLSSSQRKAMNDDATQLSFRLIQAKAEFPNMDDYSPASAEESADLQTSFLYGLLDLSPQQFAEVREALAKYEKQALQNPQYKLKLPDLEEMGPSLDQIQALLSDDQRAQLKRSLQRIATPGGQNQTKSNEQPRP